MFPKVYLIIYVELLNIIIWSPTIIFILYKLFLRLVNISKLANLSLFYILFISKFSDW
jgi:hypothetical protein